MNKDRCVMCGRIIPEGRMVCHACAIAEPNFETTKIMVSLNKLVDIAKFVRLVSRCKDDVVIKSGNYAINAKSFLGLLSLDLTKPVIVEFHGDIPWQVVGGLKKFIVN